MFVNFFNKLFKPAVNIVQNIVRAVQQLSQVVANYAGTPQPPADTPATQPTSTPVTTTTPAERERLRRQQAEVARKRKLARMEADFERDVAHKEAGDEQPLKYPAGYLSKPADADIRWLGDPDVKG